MFTVLAGNQYWIRQRNGDNRLVKVIESKYRRSDGKEQLDWVEVEYENGSMRTILGETFNRVAILEEEGVF